MEGEQKECEVCAGSIPVHARKCNHCGEFQSRWRYLHLSQLSMALLVALLAVGSQAFVGMGALLEWWQRWSLADDEKLQVAIIDIGVREASFAVYNKSEDPVFLTSVGCALSPLIDPISWSASTVSETTDEGVPFIDDGNRITSENEVLHGLSAIYKLESPYLIGSGESVVLSFSIEILAYIEGLRADHSKAGSVCSLGGVDRSQDNISTTIFFSADEIFNYDVIDAVYFAVMTAVDRSEILQMISDARKESARETLTARGREADWEKLQSLPYYELFGPH